MTLFQVGPRPNAVSCLLDPTRLPAGQMHCQPRLLVGDRSLRAIGAPTVLRQLQDARQEAQNRGIQIDATLQGGDILVTRVIASARPTPPPAAPTRTRPQTAVVARANLAARIQAPPVDNSITLFETIIDGFEIRLSATPPGGAI